MTDVGDLERTELLAGSPEGEGTVDAPPPRWLVVGMVEDGAVDVVLTTAPDAHGRGGGPPVVVVCPADRVAYEALRDALSVWRREDGLYRYSAPVEALCDALRILATMDGHHEAARQVSQVTMGVAQWWTGSR